MHISVFVMPKNQHPSWLIIIISPKVSRVYTALLTSSYAISWSLILRPMGLCLTHVSSSFLQQSNLSKRITNHNAISHWFTIKHFKCDHECITPKELPFIRNKYSWIQFTHGCFMPSLVNIVQVRIFAGKFILSCFKPPPRLILNHVEKWNHCILPVYTLTFPVLKRALTFSGCTSRTILQDFIAAS